MNEELHGAFSTRFSQNRRWRVDTALVTAMKAVISQHSRIIDFGAGIGRYVNALREHGYDCSGLDGIPSIEKISNGLVQWCDLSVSCFGLSCDWAISIETGEHIPPENETTFIQNIVRSASRGIVISWAVPGQRGRGHVNCRMPEYVASEFIRLGHETLRFDHDSTLIARSLAGKGWNRKLLVFKRLAFDSP